jgi:hypothetical protein
MTGLVFEFARALAAASSSGVFPNVMPVWSRCPFADDDLACEGIHVVGTCALSEAAIRKRFTQAVRSCQQMWHRTTYNIATDEPNGADPNVQRARLKFRHPSGSNDMIDALLAASWLADGAHAVVRDTTAAASCTISLSTADVPAFIRATACQLPV